MKSNVSQFADDIVIWTKGKDLEKIGKEMNSKLKKFSMREQLILFLLQVASESKYEYLASKL